MTLSRNSWTWYLIHLAYLPDADGTQASVRFPHHCWCQFAGVSGRYMFGDIREYFGLTSASQQQLCHCELHIIEPDQGVASQETEEKPGPLVLMLQTKETQRTHTHTHTHTSQVWISVHCFYCAYILGYYRFKEHQAPGLGSFLCLRYEGWPPRLHVCCKLLVPGFCGFTAWYRFPVCQRQCAAACNQLCAEQIYWPHFLCTSICTHLVEQLIFYTGQSLWN